MGKNLEHHSSSVSIENNHPGCMWSILHVLKYHHWRYIKKKLHHKSGGNRKHAKWDGNPGNILTDSKVGGTPQSNNTGNHHSTVIDKKTQFTSATKASVKSRIKSRISDELSKRKGRHCRSSTYPIRSPMMQTDSFRHTELSDEDLVSDIRLSDGCLTIAEEPTSSTTKLLDPSVPTSLEDYNREDCGPMLTSNHLGHNQVDMTEKELIENHSLLQENSNDKRQKSVHVKGLSTDASAQQSKEILDALDMINIDKDILKIFLQDLTNPLAHYMHHHYTFTTKMGYSVSFPLPGSSYGIGSGARTGKQKQEGLEKLQAGSHTQKSVEPKYREYIRSKSMPSIAAANSALGSSHRIKNHAQNQVVVKHFKNLKQKIRHAIKESKNEKHRITMDAILHKIPHGHRFSKNLERIGVDNMMDHFMSRDGKDSPKSSYDYDHSLPSTSNSELYCISRTVSFSESLDRYCQLYDSSFNKEAKQHFPETLKMKAEDGVSFQMGAAKSMRRIFSLPDLKSFPYCCEDSSGSFPVSQVRTMTDDTLSTRGNFCEQNSLSHPTASEQFLGVDTKNHVRGNNVESESDSVIGDELGTILVSNVETHANCTLVSDDLSNLMTVDKQDILSPTETITEVVELTTLPVPDSKLQDETTRHANIFVAEDLNYSKNNLAECSMDTLTMTVTEVGIEKIDFLSNILNNDSHPFQVDAKDKAEFDYVKDVLTLSGFTGNELLGTWNSDDQPVHHSIFEEAEGCMLLDPECCGNEGGNCHHLLLFDLINEVLMEIYANSYTYYPVPLSSLSHVRPMPVGRHVLEEVWTNISWYLSSTTEGDHSLDHALSRDLAKRDGWMNLQYDTECAGLELEDLIFEDLLEEILCA
ncbi:hypothetical protein POPTR_016G095500v4 [Populus trichocarpa]|uniref:Uncharacterized protein n=1 Tax=Populus trichocarpa TaxID=3694 RepID=A0ACC0RU39_POPTR|nr:uncharacterized protein LOC7486498 isoform X2 [Populus trichocarpa]XP_024443908.2 uncharacterized protein LOC7486498 isoform X2 [Populus trichocarpa]XP_024443910.2 uncharacterized protein LOC7486498 isoform X2 [Populus trichocarpa]KAI9380477.1 hypothetical protein POPTR_016G095500v4 [Populus trichocarpa]